MQDSLIPRDIAPQFLHEFIFDLKELKPKNTKSNNKSGIRNKSNKILPRKLMKKFIPKKGKIISIINE